MTTTTGKNEEQFVRKSFVNISFIRNAIINLEKFFQVSVKRVRCWIRGSIRITCLDTMPNFSNRVMNLNYLLVVVIALIDIKFATSTPAKNLCSMVKVQLEKIKRGQLPWHVSHQWCIKFVCIHIISTATVTRRFSKFLFLQKLKGSMQECPLQFFTKTEHSQTAPNFAF